jgi:hypothetical protein
LEWDAPITRLQERNTYRQSLIEFQQARRDYYSFEDGVWQLLRAQIRQLQANRFSFELGRQSVRIAASQLELNEDIRAFRDARGLSSGPTAARDTISALTDLLNSQNSLLNVYVNYEVVRRGLNFDLGTMELTPEGLWIDPGPLTTESMLLESIGDDGMLDCGCTNCGIRLRPQPVEPSYGLEPMIESATEWSQDIPADQDWIETPIEGVIPTPMPVIDPVIDSAVEIQGAIPMMDQLPAPTNIPAQSL